MEQETSQYSFQALFKSISIRKQNKRYIKDQQYLPMINSKDFNNQLLNTTHNTNPKTPMISSPSKQSNTTTLDSSYYKVSKTLQAIRNRAKVNHTTFNLPKTMKNFGVESIQQMNDRRKRKELLITKDTLPLTEFLSESKEICLKNVLNKIIKTESNRIEENEVNIGKALNIEKFNLENDQNTFQEYSDQKAKSFREIERQLLDLEKHNKMLLLKFKDIRLENELIKEEIKKYISLVEKARQYAFFIHKLLKGGQSDLFQNEYTKAEDIFKNYNSIAIADDDILENPNQFIKKSKELEDIIVRLLLKKEEMHIETEKISKEHQKTLNDLSLREEELKTEYDKFSNEYISMTKDSSKLNTTISPLMPNSEFALSIQELHKELFSIGGDNITDNFYTETIKRLKNPNRTVLDLTRECNEKLKAKEMKLNESISRLMKYEQDSKTFSTVIFKRKHVIKNMKQLEAKEKMKRMQNKRREQAEERANRLIIKSRKTQAPFAMNRKVQYVYIDTKDSSEAENSDLIHYN